MEWGGSLGVGLCNLHYEISLDRGDWRCQSRGALFVISFDIGPLFIIVFVHDYLAKDEMFLRESSFLIIKLMLGVRLETLFI